MYSIEVPDTVHQYIGMYYRFRIWSYKDVSLIKQTLNCLHFILFILFVTSMAIGAYASQNEDERIFLAVVTFAYIVQINRLWYIIWRKDGFLSLMQQVGTHYSEDQNEFVDVRKKLNGFTKIAHCYITVLIIGSIPSVFMYPIVNKKHLLLYNIAFPLDRSSTSKIGFWMAYVFVAVGAFNAVISVIFMSLCWYLMLSLSIKLQLLGGQFSRMGTLRSGWNISKVKQYKYFEEELNVAIQSYERINELLDEFGLYFGRSIFLQISTGSACICGGLYALAFSSHEDLGQHIYKCIFLTYSVFDIFVVMYLGSQIQATSAELSKRIYESNWIEQTQSCRKSIIILTERLKQPHELFVGKIYPLNLLTFTSIVKGAYSMFNILQSLRK